MKKKRINSRATAFSDTFAFLPQLNFALSVIQFKCNSKIVVVNYRFIETW